MASVDVQQTNIYVFEVRCPSCHRNRDVKIDQFLMNQKEFGNLICQCGKILSPEALKYLFRTKGFMDFKTHYYVV